MNVTHHWSRGSGKDLCTEIRSLTYWLNALLSQPSSTSFFVCSDMLVGNITGLPISPGATGSGSRGTASTPSPMESKSHQDYKHERHLARRLARELITARHCKSINLQAQIKKGTGDLTDIPLLIAKRTSHYISEINDTHERNREKNSPNWNWNTANELRKALSRCLRSQRDRKVNGGMQWLRPNSQPRSYFVAFRFFSLG